LTLGDDCDSLFPEHQSLFPFQRPAGHDLDTAFPLASTMAPSKTSDDTLLVVGGGQMARALVGGMLRGGAADAGDVTVVDPDPRSQDWWHQNHPDISFQPAMEGALASAAKVLLAIKPHVLPDVLDTPSNPVEAWGGKLLLSIAAGVPLKTLARGAGHGRVVRVMPNTPSLVGQGASGYCTGPDVTDADRSWVERILGSVGTVVGVTEAQIDAVTGVSGSGPAYVFVMIEALADGGVAAGLPRSVALQLATQTVLGAATMVRDSGQHPAQLKDNVCSPGGTTIAAVGVLEQNGFRAGLIDAVIAAAAKSRQLGGG